MVIEYTILQRGCPLKLHDNPQKCVVFDLLLSGGHIPMTPKQQMRWNGVQSSSLTLAFTPSQSPTLPG